MSGSSRSKKEKKKKGTSRMTVDDERFIERYASNPGSLSEAERNRVEELLHSDPSAAKLLGFFRQYYDEMAWRAEDPLRDASGKRPLDGQGESRFPVARPDRPAS